MAFGKPSGALDKAAKALATAGGVAHIAFFTVFAFRVVSGGGFGRFAHILYAGLALIGLGSEFLGWSLIKFGGRTRVRRLGMWAIALSTGLAAVLLVIASITS